MYTSRLDLLDLSSSYGAIFRSHCKEVKALPSGQLGFQQKKKRVCVVASLLSHLKTNTALGGSFQVALPAPVRVQSTGAN
jgi:hypothetical protein